MNNQSRYWTSRIRRRIRSFENPARLIYKLLRGPDLYRRLTSQMRLLPDFLIIGAMRSGTTSLFNALVGHPSVQAPVVKEIHYFDKRYQNGLNWYQAHFPRHASDGIQVISGEATPQYIFDPRAPERVHKELPEIRLIAILRNPVDRAYSHYWHQVRRGHEMLEFEEAVEQEPGRLAADPKVARYNRHHFSYLSRGRYAEQLSRWLAWFPKRQLKVISTEQFHEVPAAILRTLADFMGIDPERWPLQADRRYNVSSYATMDPNLRRRLVDHFLEKNRLLFELIDESFDWDR